MDKLGNGRIKMSITRSLKESYGSEEESDGGVGIKEG